MNTKQILHNALTAQLEAKKLQTEEYIDKVYNPPAADLKNDILEYFTNKVNGFSKFNFNGTNIRLEIGDNYYNKVEILLENYWKEDNNLEVKMQWNGGEISSKASDNKNTEYFSMLNGVYNNFKEISDKYLNEWYPKYRDIENKRTNAWREYEELKEALDKLSTEIKTDAREAMKQIGFEIKKFKENTSLDWNYNRSEYKITTNDKLFYIQYGRSKYDKIYVGGFKVIGKKGNKYKVDVYRDDQSATYDVLEKKFESFIDRVSGWENEEADRRAKNAQNDYESYTKK